MYEKKKFTLENESANQYAAERDQNRGDAAIFEKN